MALTTQPCHSRSVSLPSAAHPFSLRVEQGLHKIRSCAFATSSNPTTMPGALRELTAVYAAMEELPSLPCIQQQKAWLEDELDESVRVLDLCCALKEALAATKEHVEELRLGIRRRDNVAFDNKLNAYICSCKKQSKDVKKRFRSLKQMDIKCNNDKRRDAPLVVLLSTDVKTITISLLQKMSSLFSPMQTQQQRSSRWSFATRRKTASEKMHDDGKEAGTSDLFSSTASLLCILGKDADEGRVQKAQDHLETLENSIEELEEGLHCLFRQLIQNRVTLLNILSS